MAKLVAYFFVAVVLCQSIGVFSRQIDFDQYDFDQFVNEQNNNNNNNNNPRLPTPGISGTTTTTASPQFTNCLNSCQTTPQYNPVCGTNEVSYNNVQRLQCARNCGLRVEVAHGGTCGRSPGGK